MIKTKKRLFNIQLVFISLVFVFLFCSFLIAVFPSSASTSATLSLTPASGSYLMGNDFSLSVVVDTGGSSINAAEADLIFDKSKFSVSSIDTSKSIFTIWVENPSFSNTNGTIHFSGGIPNPGFSGVGSIFTINFKGIAVGSGDVSFASGEKVLLNDGIGTNAFGNAQGGTYIILENPLSVSCSASSDSTTINNPVTFSAQASGGSGTYVYSWSNACAGTSSTCTKSYNTEGLKTATVTVTSGSRTSSSDCSVSINPLKVVGLQEVEVSEEPSLSVSCSASSDSITIGNSVTFTAQASGGNGSYVYSWSNACTGSSSTCTKSYNTEGVKTATVTVTSGNQTSSADCSLSIYTVNESESEETGVNGSVESESKSESESTEIIRIINEAVEEQISVPVRAVVEETKRIVETPEGSIITKTVTTTGAVAAVSSLFSISFFELFLLPLRLFGLLFAALGLKKKHSPWGVVYDSVTKQPLDPAYVVLKNSQGKEISSAITDLDGRFGFLVEPGVYQMQARKTNYKFPSQKLAGRTQDELYANLYFGEKIYIKTSGEVIIKNIPLDPVKFDWNEFAKKNKSLMKFYSKWDVIITKIFDFFSVTGFIVAIVSYIFAPYPYNTAIIILYLLMILFRVFGLKARTYGHIVDKMTGTPLSFPIVRVIMSDSNREITSKSADRYGKYYCLVPPGKYYVKIEKKNEDGSYSLAYTSSDIDVSKKGIIKEKFKV